MLKNEFRLANFKLRNNSMTDLQKGRPDHTTIAIQNGGSKEDSESRKHLVVLGISLDSLPRATQFLVCCGGVFLFYLIYGYVQEWIFRTGMKPFGWYLTLVQFALYAVFGMVETSFKADKTRKIPLKTYSILAFLTVATMGLSNTSLNYLNYPTQVIFKCCKLIPVMIGGIIIQGELILYFLLSVDHSHGLISFLICSSFFIFGNLFIFVKAVVAQTFLTDMKSWNTGVSRREIKVLYSYGIGFIYIFIGLVFSGGLWPAFKFCSQNPVQAYGLAFIFSITGYLGITFVLTLVRAFGALLAVTVTTGRKAVTMVLSFIFFAKPFTIHYVWSGGIVLLGIFLNVYSKNEKQINAWIAQQRSKYLTQRQKRTPLMENV
ncbi:unnamed protein product [Porites evermanni]|uniref:Adenosine 3'-phospho 5'-phosphosulfate transporter 2 n=1 Tax=Porites evermanni TaxID=104178 RepID=A0ABN8LXZ4_9CNID|nr:unnamed protein product [Porites evermanni]